MRDATLSREHGAERHHTPTSPEPLQPPQASPPPPTAAGPEYSAEGSLAGTMPCNGKRCLICARRPRRGGIARCETVGVVLLRDRSPDE